MLSYAAFRPVPYSPILSQAYVRAHCRAHPRRGRAAGAVTHPYGLTPSPIHLLGNRFIRGFGSPKSMVLYYALPWLGRTVFPHSAAQATDGLLPEFAHARRSSFFCDVHRVHLRPRPDLLAPSGCRLQHGQGLIGSELGGVLLGTGWSRGNYVPSQALLNPGAGLAAHGLTAGLCAHYAVTWARMMIPFPFHPQIILGTFYGDGTPYGGPFLWPGRQRLALRYGSLPAYRKLVPRSWLSGHCSLAGSSGASSSTTSSTRPSPTPTM